MLKREPLGGCRSHSPRRFMPTICKESKLLTVINIFTVEPAKQRELVDLLIRAAGTSVDMSRASFQPLSTGVSTAGRSPCMPVAQQRGLPSDAQRPVASPYLDQALALAKFEPGCMSRRDLYAGSRLTCA